MAYRSFTALATRKSPAFRGKSLLLDGITDFIDFQADDGPDFEQCNFAFRHSNRHSTQNTTSDFFQPASFAMWVKFPASTISDVQSSYTAGNDMDHFIFKNLGCNETNGGNDWVNFGNETSLYWAGIYIGLVGAADGNVRLAAGWGTFGGQTIGKRIIRHGDDTVAADTWYHVSLVVNGKDQNNGMSGDTAYGITLYLNSAEQRPTVFYPSGTTSGELNVPIVLNSAGDLGYYVPASFNDDNWPGDPHLTWLQFAAGYAATIGKNYNDYMSLYIHDFVYWGETELDQDDINGLYNRQNINLINYHTNHSTYDKGEDVHATVPHLDFTGDTGQPTDETITLTDMHGVTKIFTLRNSDAGNSNGDVLSDGTINVNYDDGSGGNINNTECCKSLLAAITSAFGGVATSISAAFNSSSPNDFITLTQNLGGSQGNTSITYSNTLATDYVRAASSAAAPTAFTGGIDRIHGVWKFRGPRTDSSLNSALNAIDNRSSEWNEDPLNAHRARVPDAANSMKSLNELPMRTMPVLNHGGLWVGDIPPNVI